MTYRTKFVLLLVTCLLASIAVVSAQSPANAFSTNKNHSRSGRLWVSVDNNYGTGITHHGNAWTPVGLSKGKWKLTVVTYVKGRKTGVPGISSFRLGHHDVYAYANPPRGQFCAVAKLYNNNRLVDQAAACI